MDLSALVHISLLKLPTACEAVDFARKLSESSLSRLAMDRVTKMMSLRPLLSKTI